MAKKRKTTRRKKAAAGSIPIRFSKSTEFDFDEVMDKMIASAGKFNVDRVKQEDVAKAGGAPPED